MATPRVIHKQLDPAILQQMEEPISVTVSRVMGGARTPLLLPSRRVESTGIEYGPGDGWEKTDIQQLEGWLVTDFSGGGLYNIKIVDAKGLAFEWQPYFDPKAYPQKMPYTMQPSSMPASAVAPTMTDISEWPPRNIPAGTPFATPIPTQVPMSLSSFPYSNIARVSTADEDRRRHEESEKSLRDQLARVEREKLEEKHRADLAAISAANDRKLDELKASLQPKTDDVTTRRLDKLEGLIERLVEKISAAPSGPSPEIAALQEQNRQFQAKIEAQEAERRHREELASMERRIEALAARPTGPDPMMTIIVDAMKDNQRQMQTVVAEMGKQMLTPQDVLNLAKSTSSGLDDLRTGVVKTFQEIFELQKRAFESAAQMLPQGESPAVRIIEQGMEKAGQMFENWQQSKDAGQVAQAKAVAAQARAHEAAINAQRDQLSEMARREERMAQNTSRAVSNAAHVPRNEGQLAGAPVVEPSGHPTNVIPIKPPTQPDTARRIGKTDLEWFGGALAHVERLREGVATFLAGIAQSPPAMTPDGKPVGIEPEIAAGFVLRSVEEIIKSNLPVPAFVELYIPGRLEDFAMVLLPAAPPQYRRAVIDEIIKLDEGEDDDEGDDDEDDDEPEVKQEAAKPADQPQPAKAGGKRPPRPPQPRA